MHKRARTPRNWAARRAGRRHRQSGADLFHARRARPRRGDVSAIPRNSERTAQGASATRTAIWAASTSRRATPRGPARTGAPRAICSARSARRTARRTKEGCATPAAPTRSVIATPRWRGGRDPARHDTAGLLRFARNDCGVRRRSLLSGRHPSPDDRQSRAAGRPCRPAGGGAGALASGCEGSPQRALARCFAKHIRASRSG